MTSKDGLEPCPFCGGTEIDSHGDDKVVGYHCLTCEAVGPNQYITYPEAMYWNTRAQTTNTQTARILQHLIKTEGLDAAYVWLGEVAATTPDEAEFSQPGDVVHDL